MTKYVPFNNQNSKLNHLYDDIIPISARTNPIKSTIIGQQIIPLKKITHAINEFSKITEIEIDTTPIIYNLYDFLGITYQTGNPAPEPSSAYESGESGGWLFKYPIQAFRVPQNQTPSELTGGTLEEDWEYTKTIAVINQAIYINNITEELLNYTKLKSYLYNQNNEDVSCDDFSELYRWHKEPNGYTFYYNAFFTIEQEDSQVFLKANLLIGNPKNFDSLQKYKI